MLMACAKHKVNSQNVGSLDSESRGGLEPICVPTKVQCNQHSPKKKFANATSKFCNYSTHRRILHAALAQGCPAEQSRETYYRIESGSHLNLQNGLLVHNLQPHITQHPGLCPDLFSELPGVFPCPLAATPEQTTCRRTSCSRMVVW